MSVEFKRQCEIDNIEEISELEKGMDFREKTRPLRKQRKVGRPKEKKKVGKKTKTKPKKSTKKTAKKKTGNRHPDKSN